MKAKNFCLISLNYNGGGEDEIIYNKRDLVERVNYYINRCRVCQVSGEIIVTYIRLGDDYKHITEQSIYDGCVDVEIQKEIERITIEFPNIIKDFVL